MLHSLTTRRLGLMLPILIGLGACDAAEDEDPLAPELGVFNDEARGLAGFEVYTQNLYLGGSTSALFDPAVIADPVALLGAVNGFWADVQASDISARMGEVADLLALRNPDLMGVQEGLQFVTLDGTFQPDGAAFVDMLAELQSAIAGRGLPYEVAVVQPTTSSALPLQIDFSTGAVTQYLGFTDRVAILKRSDVNVTDVASAVYGAAVPVAPGVDIKRGWSRVTVDRDGLLHHFVNTHLETQQVRPVHDLQAAELMGVVDALDGVTILAGDLNSDAEATAGDASWTPTYGNLVAAGFEDVWAAAPRAGGIHGSTCCQDPDLMNRLSSLEERIDFVLVRSSAFADVSQPAPYQARVVGNLGRDKTPSGLWPSDHAGIMATLFTWR